MTKPMNRRIFLRGLGGACVAAPFLSSVAERVAKSQSATPPGTPKRFIAMFTHYGCLTTKFFPTAAHGPITAADLQATTLAPLAPYADKVLLPRGIRSMNEWTASMVRGQGNDPHTQVVGSFFTCQPVTPNSDDPFSFDSATKFNAKPVGASLDHVMADQLSSDGNPLFMRVGNRNDSPQSAISYSGPETSYPGLGQPSQILSGLTGLFDNTAPMTPDTYAAVRGKSVIDIVRDDLDTLERFDMSQADKMKLDAWKELLNQTTGVVASAQCNQDLATMLGATSTNVNAVKAGNTDVLTATVSSTLDGADIYSSLAALAAICNANPVIFLKYPGSYVFSGLGINLESHSASHRLNNANMSGTCVDGVLGMLTKIQDFYAQKFAKLVGMLDSIDEGNGTALDNSAAVWFQEMSDGNAHNLNNLPIVQAGGAGGYFKTGWSVNVEDASPTLSRGNSEGQCNGGSDQVNGINQSTGTDAKVGNAPINKYFVNIMNAMGMKAGADGFAAKGGSAEVTKFGFSDKTEDFIHGGGSGATIHSPGGFDALKAGA